MSSSSPSSSLDSMMVTVGRFKNTAMYRVPPRVGLGTRYFADAWQTDNPTATVELVLRSNDEQLVLQFFKDSQLMCESPPIPLKEINKTKPLDAFVEKVADSSRYFVVRL